MYYTVEVDKPVCVEHEQSKQGLTKSTKEVFRKHNDKFEHTDTYQDKLNSNFDLIKFSKQKSKCSCQVKDIKGFIFGG